VKGGAHSREWTCKAKGRVRISEMGVRMARRGRARLSGKSVWLSFILLEFSTLSIG
jgi:hypothetical protein